MLWALMIIAMVVSAAVYLGCFFLKVKNFPLTLALQFFASLGATYGLSYTFAGSFGQYGMDSILLTCVGVSFAITVLFMLMRRYLGSWYDNSPGAGVK